jgi:hypothetical protein
MKITRRQLRKLIKESMQQYPGPKTFPGHDKESGNVRRFIDYTNPEYGATPYEKLKIIQQAEDNYDKNISSGMEQSAAEQIYNYQSQGYASYKNFLNDRTREEAYEKQGGFEDLEIDQKVRDELTKEFPSMDFETAQPGVDIAINEFIKQWKEDSLDSNGRANGSDIDFLFQQLSFIDKLKQNELAGTLYKKHRPDAFKKLKAQGFYSRVPLNEISIKALRRLIKEELKRLSYVSKEQGHTYGIEHLPNQYDQKKADDIIGHT